MACADTSFIIALLRRNPDVLKKLDELVRNKTEIYTTAITGAELYNGVHKAKNPQDEEAKVNSILLSMKGILPLSAEAGKKWGQLKNEPSLAHFHDMDLDLLIASIALVENQPQVLTKNIKHFSPVPGITVQTW